MGLSSCKHLYNAGGNMSTLTLPSCGICQVLCTVHQLNGDCRGHRHHILHPCKIQSPECSPAGISSVPKKIINISICGISMK